MVGQSVVNRTFAGGEIAPSLQARADQNQYLTGLNLARNFVVRRDGTIWNRPGTGYIRQVKDSTKQVRVIEWKFNNSLTYVLELGDLTMRFIQNGVPVTIGTPAAYAGGTTYKIGELVVDGGVNYWSRRDYNLGNTPAANPDWWYALTDDIFEVPTPWAETEIFDVQFDQRGDIMYLVHPDHEVQKLSRVSHTYWKATDYRLVPEVPREGQFNLTATTVVGTIVHNYKVTLVTDDYEESLPIVANGHVFAITGLTQANPITITAVGHTFANGDEVIIYDTGIPEIDGRSFLANNIAGNNFDLDGEDGTNYQPYVAGGFAGGVIDTVTTGEPTKTAPTLVTVLDSFLYQSPSNLRTGDIRYFNVYKDIGDGYGYIGSLDIGIIDPAVGPTYSFNDNGITPDQSIKPPRLLNYFQSTDNFPSTVQFIQQRLSFAASNDKPETIWMSRIGFYENFTTSDQVSADDAISFIPSARTIDRIVHVVDSGRVILLTEGGEWIVQGDENGTIRPTAINALQIGYEGSDKLNPIVIGSLIIYVQARSRQIRSIIFDDSAKGFNPNDISKWAQHLFEGKTIVDWAYQKLKDSILWMVMSDGTMVSLTFIIDEGITAFCRHETDGSYESVCVVPEGTDDAPYFVVKRNINGSDVRYVERMADRAVTDVRDDAYFLDSFATYDGRNSSATTLTLSGGPPWGVDDGPFVLTASAAEFTAGDVGNAFVLDRNTNFKLTVTNFTSTTQVEGEVNRDVPLALQGVAVTDWCRAVDTITGLDHLEGEEVGILADGNALAPATVSSGEITLDDTYCVVHVGLAYVSDMETLDVESLDSTLIDKKKRVNNMTMIVENSRGGWAGPDENSLVELKQLKPGSYQEATATLLSGRFQSILKGRWLEKGKLFIRQQDPLPLHIIALVPHGAVGD